jgi:hypothetical protein
VLPLWKTAAFAIGTMAVVRLIAATALEVGLSFSWSNLLRRVRELLRGEASLSA